MIYIFVYNVISIKADFSSLKSKLKEPRFILVGSGYCLRNLNTKNYCCFEAIHEVSRNFHHIDYDSLNQIVESYVQEHGAQNIRLLTNEDSTQINCAKLRELYGIPGDSVSEILPFVDKSISKRQLAKAVDVPKFLLFDKQEYKEKKNSYLNTFIEYLQFPMFAKPIDLVSSIGTYKIDDFATLQYIAEKISASEYDFEIDEFIEEDLFHCDIILNKGKIKFFMVGKYAYHLAQFSKGLPMGSIPVIEKALYDDFYTFANKVIKKLKCKSGAYHLEVFFNHRSKKFIFLEIAARTPGALLPMSYEIQFGVNIEELHYLAKMGLLAKFKMPDALNYAGWVTFPRKEGTVSDIQQPLISVQNQFIKYVSVGEALQQSENLLDASCSVIFWDASIGKIQSTFETLKCSQPIK